jgi:hypothetical protein
MKARCLGVTLLALVLLLVMAPAALAKGASALRITGPGLDKPISLRGLGEPGTEGVLAEISDRAGLFAVMFGDNGGRLSTDRPAGDLGPRYTITWSVPGDGGTYTVLQDLYPWAAAGSYTYAKPGQPLWGGQPFIGGWFRTPAALLTSLETVGFPSRSGATGTPAPAAEPAPAAPVAASPAAAVASDQRSTWAVAATAAGVTAILLVTAALTVRTTRRRGASSRTDPGTAPPDIHA